MIRITVSGRHMDVRDALKSYASEKAGKLERFYDRVHSVDIVFDKQANSHRCEMIAKADHHTSFVAKEEHDDPYAALDASVKDLERQITRHKEKHRNRKHPTGMPDKGILSPSPEDSSASSLEGDAP